MDCKHLVKFKGLALFFGIIVASPVQADGQTEMSRGLQALKLKNYQAAIVHLSAAIQAADLEPRVLSDAHYFRSRALIRSREQALAINDLGKAILYWSENVKALRVRCRALTLDRKFNAAEADCDQAVELAPDDWRGWFTRGLLRRDQDQPDKAKDDFSAAKQRMPEALKAYPMVARQFREFGLSGDGGEPETNADTAAKPKTAVDDDPSDENSAEPAPENIIDQDFNSEE